MNQAKFPEAIKPGGHMPSGLPFSEGMRAGNLFFLSGQLGTLPGKLELNNKTAEDEFRQVMENVFATLKANGLGGEECREVSGHARRHERLARLQQNLSRIFRAALSGTFGIRHERSRAECACRTRSDRNVER